jgi:hypothetical protein
MAARASKKQRAKRRASDEGSDEAKALTRKAYETDCTWSSSSSRSG